MGDTGGAATDATVGTHLGMVANGAHVKEIYWKRIALLVASCFWLFITTSLAFLIRFMTRRLFRLKSGDDNSQHGDSSSALVQQLEKIIEASKSEGDSDASKGKEEPVFQFRFSFQVPDESLRSRDVQGNCEEQGAVPSMTTSVSNYRFLSKGDLRGFLEAPQAMAMCVQESYMGSDGVVLENTEELDGELRSRFSRLTCSRQDDSIAGKPVREGGEANNCLHSVEVGLGNTEELDMELNNRLSSVKFCGPAREAGHGRAVCRSLDTDGVVPDDAEELDRELRKRLSAVKPPRQAYLATTAAIHGDRGVCASSCSDGDVVDNTQELDKELTTSFLSVKRSNSDFGTTVSNWTGGLSPGTACEAEESEELEPVILFTDQENQLCSVTLPLEASSPAEAYFVSERNTGRFSPDMESESISDGYSVKDLNLDFDSDGFLSEGDFEQEIDKESLFDLDTENEESLESNQKSDETQLPNPHGLDTGSSVDSSGDNVKFFEDTRNSTDTNVKTMHNPHSPSVLRADVLPRGEAQLDLSQEPETPKSDAIDGEEDGRADEGASSEAAHSHNSETPGALVNTDYLGENLDEQEGRWEEPHREAHSQDDPHNSEETHLSESKELSMEESEELESLWEHQDLIDQLRMELRKVRSIGLPTILEESEILKPNEELKPWKFDAKFLHEDPMDELRKFYKSYRERMRKFDILNYQKMYAVGFLQLKDPLQSMGTQKQLIPAITSLFSQNIWPRRQKSSTDLSEKFVKELRSDLETVYVGQTCLSWEFLRWQYERTRELLNSTPQDGHQYNQVAGEFQQFQVLIQRFLENEPFQGPRIPNYVKNRCVLGNLLQVPLIREDCLKEKMEERIKGEDAVSSKQLEYVMENSIRVFWEFVKADKDDTSVIMKGLIGNPVELQDPADHELMADIQANLQKKEKKLKDIMRNGNCLMKKLKKPQDGRSSQDDLFFSQVDLKLVSRVLKMTRITTDQLVWCHKKLSKVTFVGRKLVRETSFFLFPC